MAFELARVKLRGIYAIIAGLVLLLGVPLFESTVMAPTGYITAITQVARLGSFAPLLAWKSQSGSVDTSFHILELAPFLLAITVVPSLRRALWASQRGGRSMAVSGQVGYALYAIAIVLGILTSSSAASDYASASTAAGRVLVAANFAGTYALQTLIAGVVGGILLAVSILLASVRIIQTHSVARWLGYVGIVPAGLLIATAVQFAAAPTHVETATSPLAFAALALWLVCLGTTLARLRTLPSAPVVAEGGSPMGASRVADVTSPSDGAAPAHQADDQ